MSVVRYDTPMRSDVPECGPMQYLDRPIRWQTNLQSVKSRTSQLADGEFLSNHGLIIIYLYTKKPNTNPIVFSSVLFAAYHIYSNCLL